MTQKEREDLLQLKALAQEALNVQDACNLSGVAHSFSRAMSNLFKLVENTDERNHHPISVLWASKISSLTNADTSFTLAYEYCKRLTEDTEDLMKQESIYDRMVALGVEIDHHESDLYVPVTEETAKIIDEYEYASNVKTFRSQTDGKMWYDIPFAYIPWWLVGR